MEFSRSQTEAIEHKNGPALILAGPGSGKTAVITERTSRLITEHGVDPSRILVITFTRAAAREMEERFIRRMGKQYSGDVWNVSCGIFYGPQIRLSFSCGKYHKGRC